MGTTRTWTDPAEELEPAPLPKGHNKVGEMGERNAKL